MANPRDSLVNSLIGPDAAVRGDIFVEGFLRIDGSVSGSIRATGKVVIGEHGRCAASIQARSAIIGGMVRGDVCVLEHLAILPGGVICGNVFAPRLDADADVVIHGDVMVSGARDKAEEAMLDFIRRHGTKVPGDPQTLLQPGGPGGVWPR
ncbi:MAG: polymer-forming cytoskeletal protein [Spirochaetes bacterium]|nr:polymer-forming cytoskeletal protein [Spirochaetota bacterium]